MDLRIMSAAVPAAKCYLCYYGDIAFAIATGVDAGKEI